MNLAIGRNPTNNPASGFQTCSVESITAEQGPQGQPWEGTGGFQIGQSGPPPPSVSPGFI